MTVAVARAPARRWQRRVGQALGLAGRRLLWAVPTVILVSLGVFVLAAFSPFDPLVGFFGDRIQSVSAEQRQELGRALGLDRSWWEAWVIWAGGVLHGDLGFSRVYREPVALVLAQRIPWTLLLSGVGLLIGTVFAVAGGVGAGLRPGSVLDRLCTGVAVLLSALPSYVVSLVLIVCFALTWRWFPTGGIATPGQRPTLPGVLHHLWLPALALALSVVPWLLLSVRASVRTALASDAVHGAISRGLPSRVVVWRHVLPVSLAPLVTLIGTRLPELVVGAVLVEEVFAWPGAAQATVSSAQSLDFDLLAVLTVLTTLVVLLGSLAADIIYLFLDPRVVP